MVSLRFFTLAAAMVSAATALSNNGALKSRGPARIARDEDIPTVSNVKYGPAPVAEEAAKSSDYFSENPCATALCKPGTVCEVVGDEGVCVPGTACGPSTCGRDQVCCNESCGICTAPDGFCIQIFCEPELTTVG